MAADQTAFDSRHGVGSSRGPTTAIDWPQVRALVELHLKQSFRPRTSAAGKRVNPVRQLVWVLCLFGFFFVLGARRAADLETFLILLFSSAFALLSLNILPDTLDARRRQLEILGSKPISSRTMLVARAGLLLVLAALISTCFSAIPLASMNWLYGSRWLLVPGVYVSLLAGSFAVAVLWITLLVFVSRWLNLDRLRTFVQLLLVLVSLGLMGFSLLSMGDLAGATGMSAFSFANRPLVHLLPSTWFAKFPVHDLTTTSNLERAGALAIVGAALFVGLRVDMGKRYPELLDRLLASDDRPVRTPITSRLITFLTGVPIAGRLMAPEAAAAVASLVLTATGREVASRLKVLAPRALLVGFFVLSLSASDAYVTPNIIAFYGFMSLIDGWEIAKQSSQAQASWVMVTSPIDAKQLSRGIHLALGVKYFALPAVLVTLTFFFNHPPLLASLLTLLFLAEARAVISLLLAVRPALPLSQEQMPAKAFSGLAVTLPVAFVTGIGYAAVVLFEELVPYAGILAGTIGLMGLIGLSFVLERAARSKLSLIEYPH